MAKKPLPQVDIIDVLSDEDNLIIESGGKIGRIAMQKMKRHLQESDMYLNQVAWFIDINEPAAKPEQVNIGGNMAMRKMWSDQWRAGVMSANGKWAELSTEDNRYFADGTPAVNIATGEVITELANANFMGVIPQTYCYLQVVDIGAKQIQRLWMSLVELPGWKEPEQIVGMFKGWVDGSGRLRSLPGKVPTASRTIANFTTAAKTYGKSYGLSGVWFRNMLLWHMMATYGQRSSQECKLPDGTLVWGVGLDGTESIGSADGGRTEQKDIPTGATLALGNRDGNVEVADSKGNICHKIKVKVFEDVWGQYWEFDGNLCSIGANVVSWRGNFLPADNAPTMDSFENIENIVAIRHTANIPNSASTGHQMNILTGNKPRVLMIPMATQAGVSYKDYYYGNSTGQVWFWGGRSGNGANCGLANSNSNNAWTNSNTNNGARLTSKK